MQFQPPSQPGWGQPESGQHPFPQQQPLYTQPGQYQQPQFYQQIQQSSSQQQQWQQPPMMPTQQPQKPPKKKVGPILGIGCGALVALVVLIAVIASAAGNHGTGSSPSLSQSDQVATSTAQAANVAATNVALQNNGPVPTVTLPTETPTSIPTQVATTAPTTGIQPTGGYDALGADIGTFVMNYGQPNDHSTSSGGLYHFKRYPGSNIDFLIIMTDVADGGVYANRVEDVTAQASDTGADAGWTQQQASATCGAFLPRDAVYKRRVDTADGYDKIYYSASLAKLFPASAFTDVSSNQVQAGLFDVFYLYKISPMIDSCDIIIGTQQTQN